MRLDQLTQSPLVVTVGNERWSVPLFTISDWMAWAKLDEEKRAERATAGMKPEQKFQFLSFYGVAAATIDFLRGQARTPAGARHICATCLGRAVVVERDGTAVSPPQPMAAGVAEKVVDMATLESLAMLSEALADPPDPAEEAVRKAQEQPDAGGETAADEAGADPLPESAKPASGA